MRKLCLMVCAGVLLAGCSSKTDANAENFTAAVNDFYSTHSECLFKDGTRFPYETSDAARRKQMDALVTMHMLSVEVEQSIHVARYATTDTGAKVAPGFCYGHRVVTTLDGFTPVATANGFPETTVSYHYKMEDVPVWAKSAEVQAAFPELARQTSGAAEGKTVLARSAVGWSVPN